MNEIVYAKRINPKTKVLEAISITESGETTVFDFVNHSRIKYPAYKPFNGFDQVIDKEYHYHLLEWIYLTQKPSSDVIFSISTNGTHYFSKSSIAITSGFQPKSEYIIRMKRYDEKDATIMGYSERSREEVCDFINGSKCNGFIVLDKEGIPKAMLSAEETRKAYFKFYDFKK